MESVAKHFAEIYNRSCCCENWSRMGGAVQQAYREVLKLIKRLPPPARGYYTQYARENFVTYSEAQDAAAIQTLLGRAHHHTCWILKKYGVDEASANRLKEICFADVVQPPA